ncbi:MAG: methyltransferase domain-containing protein [Fimbriimonadaceae bacterium]|nr:methyltransferase domain-containing protein [Fimbriimonadaceae bacterium]
MRPDYTSGAQQRSPTEDGNRPNPIYDPGWDESAEAWIEWVERGDPSRERFLDATMLEAIGDPKGLRTLDVGCGEGRFVRRLAARGAQVVGIDPVRSLLEAAHGRGGTLVRGVGEVLPFQSDAFELVVCYLALIDIADYRSALAEQARVLKPGGRLVIANLSGMASSGTWQRDAARRNRTFTMDRYLEERWEQARWAGIDVMNWHRPLSAYLEALLALGLVLRRFVEPPTPNQIAVDPTLAEDARVPWFVVMEWVKPCPTAS